jgi:phospholipid/cholesterol/gamma-HCH transport system substrate-binding protein
MAQGKQLTWVELRVGVFVLAGLTLLGIGIISLTGAGGLQPKYSLKTYLPEVDGIVAGAPVRLEGFDIGEVQEVAITPNPPDKMHNIELRMRIGRKFQNYVRTDSTASLETEGLLGNRFVTISRGLAGTPLQNGAMVTGTQKTSMDQVMEKSETLMDSLGTLSHDLQQVVENVKAGQGTIGKLIQDPQLYDRLNATAASAQELVAGVREGQGTLGKLVANDELYQKVDQTMGNANAILASVHQGQGTIGKMVNDPTMYQNAQKFLQRGNSLLNGVEQGQGTLGKLVKDDTVYNNVREATANVRDAAGKLNSNKGTMGKFFTDPDLYDNLNGLSKDARQVMQDFHNDPKKYLHVKFSIF